MKDINLSPDGKIPFIWYIDEANIFVTDAETNNAPLYVRDTKSSTESGFTFVNYIMASLNPKVKTTFCFIISPQYEAAGLPKLKRFDKSIIPESLGELHREFQEWIKQHQSQCEVVVHGWDHYNQDYLTDGSWDTMPGVQYNKRSVWYNHPNPVEEFDRCVKTMKQLGYSVVTSVFSSPGGRADVKTLKKLRDSKYKVIGKFTTQLANFPVDYGVKTDKPIYLKEIDVLVFPLNATPFTPIKEIENLITRGIPVFFANHGYESYKAWKADGPTLKLFELLDSRFSERIVYLTMSEYASFLYRQIHGEG